MAPAISIAFRQYFKMFNLDNMKETRLNRYVYDFSVNYSTVDVSDIMDIYQYLMKKNNVKQCSNLLNKLLSRFISFIQLIISLSREAKISDPAKCISLNNEQCMARPTAIN